MFLIKPQSKDAIYIQIKKQIIQFIALNILKPDDKLPSVRNLASDLGINPNTVAKAYEELEEEGIVYTLAKKGVFVSRNDNIDDFIVEESLNEFKYITKKCLKNEVSKEVLIDIVETCVKEDLNA
ncbi:GntR family transcriptional regulator [Erysipelotrichaceae bacterium OH741_COT-311]|nr:GntR family transcriptional regulator [Erysipelotrichaceae bacterium OH741_COT-311]